MIDPALVRTIREQFHLDPTGIHGEAHWARVRDNGLRLAEATGANARVVELFAVFHDSCRRNDAYDPEHGPLGAALARTMAGNAFDLDADELELLAAACHAHSDGLRTGDVTVLTCWDADRLDLGRAGIRPHPDLLCTDAAREPEILSWAYRRSRV